MKTTDLRNIPRSDALLIAKHILGMPTNQAEEFVTLAQGGDVSDVSTKDFMPKLGKGLMKLKTKFPPKTKAFGGLGNTTFGKGNKKTGSLGKTKMGTGLSKTGSLGNTVFGGNNKKTGSLGNTVFGAGKQKTGALPGKVESGSGNKKTGSVGVESKTHNSIFKPGRKINLHLGKTKEVSLVEVFKAYAEGQHPRLPKGATGGGRWTTGSGGAAVRSLWNKGARARQLEGAAAAGALRGYAGHKTGQAIGSALSGDIKGGFAHYASGTAARIGADVIERHVDLTNPTNRRVHSTAALTTALLSNSRVRGGLKRGFGAAARGARTGMNTRAANNAFAKTHGLPAPKMGKVYNAPKGSYKFSEFRGKGSQDMTRKPIIQIAMEMKKQMAAKRAGKKPKPSQPLRASFQLPVKRHKKEPPAPPPGPSTVMHVHNHFGPKPNKPMKKLAAKKPVKKKGMDPLDCPKCGAKMKGDTCKSCGYTKSKEIVAQSFIFKEADGNYRWVLLSSNGYRDRDGEIISTKALERDVALWDMEGAPAQPLRWWHVALTPDYNRGIEIGTTDFRMLADHTLIESGTFIDPVVGEAVFKAQGELAASVGFRHSPNQPNSDKIFDDVNIFERSLLPKGRQSNVLVELMVN